MSDDCLLRKFLSEMGTSFGEAKQAMRSIVINAPHCCSSASASGNMYVDLQLVSGFGLMFQCGTLPMMMHLN